MKSFFKLIGVFYAVGVMAFGGLAIGGIIVLFSSIVALIVWPKIERAIIVHSLKDRPEHLHIVGRNPLTGQEPDLGEWNEFVVFADHKDVHKTKQFYEGCFEDSGNTFYNDPALYDSQKLKVIRDVFRDGTRPNESWDEYTDYLIDRIRRERQARHLVLQEEDFDFYELTMNNQKGVNWEKAGKALPLQ